MSAQIGGGRRIAATECKTEKIDPKVKSVDVTPLPRKARRLRYVLAVKPRQKQMLASISGTTF
jgi:hypothetical protein